mmetsp:Transcript_19684/g.30845  ORF Transcript_19684/g.30845 Transcript_19684/m.30845 type:complete len:198 (-) Transcript_19684:219-812(-)
MAVTEIDTWVFMGTFVLGATLQIFLTLLTGSTMMAADASSASLDNIKVIMMSVGVLGTFVAIVYIGSIAQDVLKKIENDVSRHGLLSGQGESDIARELGLTFLYDSPTGQLVVASVEPCLSGWKVDRICSGDVLVQVDSETVGSWKELVDNLNSKDTESLQLSLRGQDGTMYEVTIDRHSTLKDGDKRALAHMSKDF